MSRRVKRRESVYHDSMETKRHQRTTRQDGKFLRLGLVATAAACAVTYVAAFSTHRSAYLPTHHVSTSIHAFLTSRRSSTALAMTGTNEPDDDEWRALVAAFQMYKAAYGDLKVPSRFIVPGMPPWPENAWGLKLGHRVAAIRSTGKYIQNNEKRRKILEDMGFLWRLRAAGPDTNGDMPSFDQIYDALVTFRKVVQPGTSSLNVPPSFVVPNCDPWPESTRGLPLGKAAPTIRSKPFLKSNPGAEEKLIALGFEVDGKAAANDTRFEKVYEALKRYKEIYGDLLVSQPFVVPEGSDEWPEDTWGLRLGARVNAIRSQGTFVTTNPERKQMLDDIGFLWNPPIGDGAKKRGRRKKEENEVLMGLAPPGILSAPYPDFDEEDFDDEDEEEDTEDDEVAESTDSAMETLFGPSFAFADDPFRPSNGVDGKAPTWGFESTSEDEKNRAAEAAANQDEYVAPRLFSETMKEATANALAVGVIDGMTETNRVIKGKREKDIPWFNDDFGGDFVFEDVVEALTVYKSMYGNFSGLDDDEFMIPSIDGNSEFEDDFEDDSFDTAASARAAAAIAAFEGDGRMNESADLIAAEIRRLKGEATATEVAVETRVTTTVWPEHLAGMGLGNIVRRVRDGSLEVKHLPERKAQLDAIAFDWGDERYFLDIPFEKAMCAMYAYYLVRGDMFVYEDFVMPDEDPWPQALAGYELGKVVTRVRRLQNFFEAYHPEKVTLLRAVDFLWFPTMALPLDPNEEEMTPEMVMLTAIGHPDYSKIVDFPMGLADKILAEGPFHESDDFRMWWKKWHNWDYVKDYWYAQGRRDNAYALRGMGFPTLAEEHEAKYGPGLFQQIDDMMKKLGEGVDDSKKEEYLQKLTFFRDEMTGCEDLPVKRLKKVMEEIDTAMLALMTGSKLETVTEDSFEDFGFSEVEGEYADVEEEVVEEDVDVDDDEEFDEDIDEEPFVEEEDDFDIDDELGLDQDDENLSEDEDDFVDEEDFA